MKLSPLFLDLIDKTCAPGLIGLSSDEVRQTILSRNDPELKTAFQLKSFAGWKDAQITNLELQLEIQSEKMFLERDPFTTYTFRNLQRLMDSIVWQHFGNTSDMKTIFKPEPIIADLRKHNIDSHVAAANENNKKEEELWLISDLTSGFKSGDLLYRNVDGSVSFVELKTGKVNSAIHNLLFNGNHEDLLKLVTKENVESIKKQLKRVVAQVERGNESRKALNNEPHIDSDYPGFKKNIVIHNEPLKEFGDKIDLMLEAPKKDKFMVIEDCLYLGVLNYEYSTRTAHEQFLATVEENLREPILGPSCDLAMYLNGTSFTKPLYVQPFAKSSIIDLLGRERSVHIYLSLSRFAKKFRSETVELDLVTGKEMRKLYSKHRGYSSKHQDTVLRIRDKKLNAEGLLSDGLLQKMFCDLFMPSELLKLNLLNIKHMKGMGDTD